MNRIDQIVARHADREGPLLPILHDVQAEIGAVDAATEMRIAELLNLTRAEVHGVVSFYHDFKAKTDPRPVIQVCRAEACQARGIEAMMRSAENAAADRVLIETVYCLGLCSVGPNARIGDDLYARLDADALAKLVEEA